MIPTEHFSKYFDHNDRGALTDVLEMDCSPTREKIVNIWVGHGFLEIVESKIYYPDRTNAEYKRNKIFVKITELGLLVLEFGKL